MRVAELRVGPEKGGCSLFFAGEQILAALDFSGRQSNRLSHDSSSSMSARATIVSWILSGSPSENGGRGERARAPGWQPIRARLSRPAGQACTEVTRDSIPLLGEMLPRIDMRELETEEEDLRRPVSPQQHHHQRPRCAERRADRGLAEVNAECELADDEEDRGHRGADAHVAPGRARQ